MGLSKILNKINKAKSAINSLKGISSKLNSLNYTTQIDKLGEEAEKASISDKIEEIVVPTHDVTEVKRGKRIQRKKNTSQAMY